MRSTSIKGQGLRSTDHKGRRFAPLLLKVKGEGQGRKGSRGCPPSPLQARKLAAERTPKIKVNGFSLRVPAKYAQKIDIEC
ncbi:hypothetical protein VNF293_43250 (plasmid) [Atlantibacter hermannii]